MKTLLKLPIIVMLLATTICCTNSNNKSNTISFKEEVIINIDTSNNTSNLGYSSNDSSNIVWSFKFVNNIDANEFIYETPPFLIFSLDSSFILINTGCNYYIGECSINGNNVKFKKIRIKEEICPIDALEREIVYMLESCNYYYIDNNNLILFKNDYPIGLLTIDTINFNNTFYNNNNSYTPY